jgi:hypothetical protein
MQSNTAEPTVLTREQLYAMLWQEPTRTIASRRGISDVGLAKICRKLYVPRPWRGSWREKETGHKPRQPKLPPWPSHLGKEPGAITFHAAARPGESPPPRPPEPEAKQQQRTYEKNLNHNIVISDILTEPDRLVRRAARLLKRTGDRDLLRPSEWSCLDIQVTQISLDRALRIFDAIIKAAQARGWSVTTQGERPFQTHVTALNEVVAIQILEKVRQVERIQPSDKDTTYLFRHERYAYEPTGLLTVRLVDEPSFAWNARTWNDSKRQRIESCLQDLMVGFVELAERQKAARREQERRQLERLEEERRRMEAAERQAREKDRREELQREIQVWAKARDVRAYVTALQDAAKEHLIREPDGRLARWIRWAQAYTKRIDPLLNLDVIPLDPEGYGREPLELDGFALS